MGVIGKGYAKVGSIVQKPAEVVAGGRGAFLTQAAARAGRPTQSPPDVTKQSWDGFLGQEREAFDKAEGALQTFGAAMGVVTGFEQAISKPFMDIPFPAFPALRVGDGDVGLPHGHTHPPNLIPPAPMIMLPSLGPVIGIPYVSGAEDTLINGRPAARCGDMGLGVWCGGFVPMFEIFLGSASVWIEGARAARTAVDITNHCIFSAHKGPGDKPIGSFIGTTIDGSPDVLIGGAPMPSLTNMAVGLAFRGAGRVVKAMAHTKPGRALTTKIAEKYQKARDAVKNIFMKDAADTLTDMHPAGLDHAADTIPDLPRAGDTLPGIGPTHYDDAVRHMDVLDIALSDFADETVDIVRKSPKLSDQVSQLHGEGYNIKRGAHPDEISRADKEIRIRERDPADPNGPINEVGAIGHEAGHGVNPEPPTLSKNGVNEGEYIDRDVQNRMTDEGRAHFNQADTFEEIRNNGGPDGRMSGNHSDDYDKIYQDYKDGKISQQEAERQMGERMKSDQPGNTNTGEDYQDYYARGARNRYNRL